MRRVQAPLHGQPRVQEQTGCSQGLQPHLLTGPHPVKSLVPIGGVGIELWTVTEDILFETIVCRVEPMPEEITRTLPWTVVSVVYFQSPFVLWNRIRLKHDSFYIVRPFAHT